MNRRPGRRTWSLAVHGGAGVNRGEALLEDRAAEIRAALRDVLAAGARLLERGGSSLDAVEETVRLLEDSPLFNAGRGSVFNARGEIELEASVMDGRTLGTGAVAGLRGIRNPVVLARRVMERSPHVFLYGEGAAAFASAEGIEAADEAWFWTAHRWKALEAARRSPPAVPPSGEHGTVGAVAIDRHGNLAAATSTGGLTNKWPGRVGDSPIIGAGCFASNDSCAVSCTGQGEFFIRATVARDIAAAIEYAGEDVQRAADLAVHHRLSALGGEGGAIAVDTAGTVAFAFNTETML
ncbi:MAG: isoaspartyl peptidase/L-asparaginase, partial [Gammaproteobacteria bacterium]|nr:isoaspartyl peptidase/L-asparaginase [Gammaproteobacteria bacterium]